jgi:hypothetical protein
MPHYKDGTLARNGDLVLHRETHDTGSEKVMIIQSITSGSDSCDAGAIPLALRQKGTDFWMPIAHQLAWCITLKECEKLGEMPARGGIVEMKEPATVGTS